MQTIGNTIDAIERYMEEDKLGKALRAATEMNMKFEGSTSAIAYRVTELVTCLTWVIDGKCDRPKAESSFEDLREAYYGGDK